MRRPAPSLTLSFGLLCAVAGFAFSARAQEEPPEVETGEDGNGNFLVIPGIGKIPLPPGVRAYGPGNGP